jgi:stearoyl-CoA desaturase (Delta-9 desaturase)
VNPQDVLIGVALGLVVTQISVFATTVYLHRGLAHRSLHLHPVVAAVSRVTIWITTGLRPREWVAVHRRHHAHTDEAGDPHSPAVLGFWRVMLVNAFLYRRVARDEATVRRHARDLPGDRWDRLFFDRSVIGLAVGVAILVLLFGWQIAVVAASVHAVTYLGLGGAVNAIGHTLGRRPHTNSGTNGGLLALFTAGEGLHNNHHFAPTSARFARFRGELDPGWWLVRVLTATRLATTRTARSSP